MNRIHISKNLLLMPMFLLLLVCFTCEAREISGHIMIASLSTDGHYVLTTDDKNVATVWNIQRHTKKIISHDANMYSAYWIKSTPYFMWQELKSHKVYVQNSKGKTIETFNPDFVVYGHALSENLQNYVASDQDWNVFLFNNKGKQQLASMYSSGTFPGANKIINFTMLGNNKILASGMAYAPTKMGPTLWSLKQPLHTIHNYVGNMGMTYATLSPDGKYVVAGDVDAKLYVWNRKTGKQLVFTWGPVYDFYERDKQGHQIKQMSGNTPIPKDFGSYTGHLFALKFIDNSHYLAFTTGSNYATLFPVLRKGAIKFFNLNSYAGMKNEQYNYFSIPSTMYYERDQSIDTSPSAHILVVGKEFDPGIMVYRYNPRNQILKKNLGC